MPVPSVEPSPPEISAIRARIAVCNHAIESDPANARAFVKRGEIYETDGDFARAAADFPRALELAPPDVDARYNGGGAYRELGDHARPLADLTAVIDATA